MPVSASVAAQMRQAALLEVNDLSVTFSTADGPLRAVRDVSFSLEAGQTLGIVGESGSGKSVCAQSIVGLTPGASISGTASFRGSDLLKMTTRRLRAIRGADIAMIFQDPLSSLHPLYRVGWQITEMLLAHSDVSKRAARERAIELLDLVGIRDAHRRIDDYPHQLSGGMRQRVMIAMAISLNPKLLIADEPTTALDVTVQARILSLLKDLQREFGTAMIFITHDLAVLSQLADHIVVMYAGRVVEKATKDSLYRLPHHPYTRGLIRSLPSTGSGRGELAQIAGSPASLLAPPSGCAFHPRCEWVMDACPTKVPPLIVVEPREAHRDQHRSGCLLPAKEVSLAESIDDQRRTYAAARRARSQRSARETKSADRKACYE